MKFYNRGLLYFILVFFISQTVIAEPFTYQKMAFIDADPITNNLLFRGNNPIVYDESQKHPRLKFAVDNPLFSNACSAKNISKHCYHLIDMTLIHNRDKGHDPTEGQMLFIEIEHFTDGKHPIRVHPSRDPYIVNMKMDTRDKYGNHLIHFPLQPILLKQYPYGGICHHLPSGVKQSWREACYKPNASMLQTIINMTADSKRNRRLGRNLDNLVELLEDYVRGKLPNDASLTHPNIIYIHCRHGLNRTGMVHVAYLLHKQYELANAVVPVPIQLSLRQIISRVESTLPAFKQMHPKHVNTIVWYCAYLNMKLTKHKKPYRLNCNYQIANLSGHKASMAKTN